MLNIEKALQNFSLNVSEEAKKNLLKKNKKASGNLYDFTYEQKTSKNSFSLTFNMPDYWEFVDRGVKGVGGQKADGSKWKLKKVTDSKFKYKSKRPPKDAFNGWVIKKGLAPRDAKGRFVSRNSMLYSIAESVYRTGLETTHFFTKPFDNYFKMLPQKLVEAYALDVEDFLKFTTKRK